MNICDLDYLASDLPEADQMKGGGWGISAVLEAGLSTSFGPDGAAAAAAGAAAGSRNGSAGADISVSSSSSPASAGAFANAYATGRNVIVGTFTSTFAGS